ncbi:hypothetical protein TUM17554_39360 [Klebsiella pneumoniae]|nr:hypothetical protein TUM17554_39360 [Klebsiella pneumoniae]
MGRRRPAGNAAGIHDGDKQPQIGEIQSHDALLPFGFTVAFGQHTALSPPATSCFNALL